MCPTCTTDIAGKRCGINFGTLRATRVTLAEACGGQSCMRTAKNTFNQAAQAFCLHACSPADKASFLETVAAFGAAKTAIAARLPLGAALLKQDNAARAREGWQPRVAMHEE